MVLLVTSTVFFWQVTAAGKAVLVTGCDNVLGNALARRLDDLGYHVFAGFQNKAGNIDADMLKEDCSGRLHTLQLDITSETQVSKFDRELLFLFLQENFLQTIDRPYWAGVISYYYF